MKVYIKYMVSLRCKKVVLLELEKLGLTCNSIDLGMVDIEGDISTEVLETLNTNLKEWGLEILDDKKKILVEKIIAVVIELIHLSDEVPKVNNSDYISERLGYSYTYLSNLFAEVEGITIQKYIILHKIEKVKELLMYGDLTLSEIAYKLHYSSVAHISNQFKNVTGLSPTNFKKMNIMRKNGLEDI